MNETNSAQTNAPEPNLLSLEQILQIALDDEKKALATYQAITQKFGNIKPFSNIIEAENRHIAEIEFLANKYQVTLVQNDFSSILAPDNLTQSLEISIAAELANVSLYDYLLQFVQDDVQDAFFRFQAASYNNHLPALRNALKENYNNGLNNEQMMGKINEFSQTFQKIANGQAQPEELTSLLQSTNLSFIGGLVAGGIASSLLSSFLEKKDN